MSARPNPELTAQVAAAFDWWREAGVDCAFHDAPADWLERPAPPVPAARDRPAPGAAPESASALLPDPAAIPDRLEDFVAWWLSDPRLDGGRASGRVPPRGAAGAGTMVIVPEPEREDGDLLLSGPQGRLLDAMLDAMGVASEAAYIASALPRHTPMPDWDALAAAGFGAALLRHVKLVRPGRLVVFGSNVLPLLGNDPTISGQNLEIVNHEGLSIPLFAARDLALLLTRPRVKARVWRQWLDWTGIGNT